MKEYICEYRTFDGSFFRFVALGERALTEALLFARDDNRVIDFNVHKIAGDENDEDWRELV